MSDSFYLPPGSLQDGSVHLDGGQARHIARVLRYGPGRTFEAFDGKGGRFRVRIVSAAPDLVTGTIEATLPENNEPAVRITLACALIKNDRFDWMVEKVTEMGVSVIVPVSSAHTVIKIDKKKAHSRLERWRKIAMEAAQQSRRSLIPEIIEPVSFGEYCRSLQGTATCAVIPCMPAHDISLRAVARETDKRDFTVLIGPEGGFSPEELALAGECGIRAVTLGKRRLRTETAATASVWSIIDTFSDF